MALPSPQIPEDMAAFDEEENEVRGTLVFKPPVEILPKTRRTEEMQRRKLELLKKRKEDAEKLLKEKEQKEKEKRQQEMQVKKEKQRLELQKKEQERKRREEEEQRKKKDGGLDRLLHSLLDNISAPDITACGIDLNPARLRLLCKNLSDNTSCRSIDLNRKGLIEEDGDSLAAMLEKNKGLLKLECEGNNLGVQAAEKIGEALRKNDTLRSLNLESNNLTASGGDQKGIIKLADALQENKSLRVLMLSKNGITAQAGEYFVRAIETNDTLTLVDLSGNDASPSVEQLRRIDAVVQRNRERLSTIRRNERRERFALYNEEFRCRQHAMQVEAMRLEIEAMQERRLNRMKARAERWVEEIQDQKDDVQRKQEELSEEAALRAETNKSKGKKKRK